MNPALLIARKDLRSYFTSPMAYIMVASFLFIAGWFFASYFAYFTAALQQFSAFNSGQKPTLSQDVFRPFFGNLNVILLFVAPFLTMRLLAEEKRDHTIELLLTAPLKSWQIVVGKFLAGVCMLSAMVAGTLLYFVILGLVASPDWGVVLVCYVGMLLVICTYVAIGLFWSSRTDNQVIAAVLTFGTLLFFWLISWASGRAGPVWSDVLDYLSLIGHYVSFAQGMVSTTDIIYYASFTGFALFLSSLSVEAH